MPRILTKIQGIYRNQFKCISAKQKKFACFHLTARVRFFFPTMRPVNFFWNKKWIKKKKKKKKKKKG